MTNHRNGTGSQTVLTDDGPLLHGFLAEMYAVHVSPDLMSTVTMRPSRR